MQDTEIALVVVRQMSHTGDAGLCKRAVVGPPGEDFVDGRGMAGWLAVGVCGHGQTLPLHARVEHPEDEGEEAMIAEFALGSALGHGEVR
jgi:hypothetical protein